MNVDALKIILKIHRKINKERSRSDTQGNLPVLVFIYTVDICKREIPSIITVNEKIVINCGILLR